MSLADVSPLPFKVWSCDRKTRKAVMATSIGELKHKGKEKLSYKLSTEHLRVVLEKDGTEIEDNVYFRTLEKDTVFLLLLPGEEWQPLWSLEAYRAGTGIDESDNPSGKLLTPETRGQEILNFLKTDIANMLLLTKTQMEEVAALDLEEMGTSEAERKTMESIQEACDRMVTEKQEEEEKMELLRRLETHLSNADAVDNFLSVCGEGLSQPVFESGPQLRHLLQEARSSTTSREASSANRQEDNKRRSLRPRSFSRKRKRQ